MPTINYVQYLTASFPFSSTSNWYQTSFAAKNVWNYPRLDSQQPSFAWLKIVAALLSIILILDFRMSCSFQNCSILHLVIAHICPYTYVEKLLTIATINGYRHEKKEKLFLLLQTLGPVIAFVWWMPIKRTFFFFLKLFTIEKPIL